MRIVNRNHVRYCLITKKLYKSILCNTGKRAGAYIIFYEKWKQYMGNEQLGLCLVQNREQQMESSGHTLAEWFLITTHIIQEKQGEHALLFLFSTLKWLSFTVLFAIIDTNYRFFGRWEEEMQSEKSQKNNICSNIRRRYGRNRCL